MGAAFPSLLDRLLGALEAARSALRSGHGADLQRVLGEAFALLGALYATLDSGRHPELSDYLQSVYDRCLLGIGEAGHGDVGELEVPLALLRQIQSVGQDRVEVAA